MSAGLDVVVLETPSRKSEHCAVFRVFDQGYPGILT
jgi:hypothetical protein